MDYIKTQIRENDIIYFKVPGCSDCNKLNAFLNDINVHNSVAFDLSHLDDDEYEDGVAYLQTLSGTKRCPMFFINGKYIGDYKKTLSLYDVGELSNIFKNELRVAIKEIDF